MARRKANTQEPVRARITVEVAGVRKGFEIDSIDFDSSQAKLANQIGTVILETIWQATEGKRDKK